jgi:hypothetical protein
MEVATGQPSVDQIDERSVPDGGRWMDAGA